jgi:hypothetical protein
MTVGSTSLSYPFIKVKGPESFRKITDSFTLLVTLELNKVYIKIKKVISVSSFEKTSKKRLCFIVL